MSSFGNSSSVDSLIGHIRLIIFGAFWIYRRMNRINGWLYLKLNEHTIIVSIKLWTFFSSKMDGNGRMMTFMGTSWTLFNRWPVNDWFVWLNVDCIFDRMNLILLQIEAIQMEIQLFSFFKSLFSFCYFVDEMFSFSSNHKQFNSETSENQLNSIKKSIKLIKLIIKLN